MRINSVAPSFTSKTNSSKVLNNSANISNEKANEYKGIQKKLDKAAKEVEKMYETPEYKEWFVQQQRYNNALYQYLSELENNIKNTSFTI